MGHRAQSNDKDFHSIEQEYEPGSLFFLTRYKIVRILEKKLPDKEMIACAKAGLLALKQKYPYVGFRYRKINSLVREAYYGYYQTAGPSRLENEKEHLIDMYQDLVERINKRIEESGLTPNERDNDAKTYVSKLVAKYIDNNGIKFNGESYSVLSFEYVYFLDAILELDNGQQSINIISFMKEIIEERITSLQRKDSEGYRLYKIDAMRLNPEEEKRYNKRIAKYNRHKRIIDN